MESVFYFIFQWLLLASQRLFNCKSLNWQLVTIYYP